MRPVVIVFRRIGPYHFARLRAASFRGRLVALEVLAKDATYAWDLVPGSAGFDRRVLFPELEGKLPSAKQVCRRIQNALCELQPAVVLIPGWVGSHARAAMEWCACHSVPAVVMSETTAWDEPRKAWRECVKRRWIQLCSAGFVGGRPHQDYLCALGVPRERVFLGYDVVDTHYFTQGANVARGAEREVRSQYGLPQHYFLASARFVEKKNLARLLSAYARYRKLCECSLHASGPDCPPLARPPDPLSPSVEEGGGVGSGLIDRSASRPAAAPGAGPPSSLGPPSAPWNLVLLGDGPLREPLKAQISALNLCDQVHLPGFKQYPDLPSYYGLASTFIHASTTEQWGLVVNEAMASSLPVLVSNRCGCASELVQAGVNGFTFDPCDVEALAQLMLEVSARNFPLRAFGEASRAIIREWGPDRFASGFAQAVQCALRVGPVRPTLLQRVILKLML